MRLRGRGWGAVLGLVLATVLLSVANPALLVFLPLALLLVALPPRRPAHALAGLVIAAVVFAGAATATDALWYAERGWALVLGAWFVLAVAAWPGAGFLPRALGSLAATLASAGVVLSATRGWSGLDGVLMRRFRSAAIAATNLWGLDPAADRSRAFSAAIYRAAELQAVVYPALLGLGSLAALGLAWWAYRRLTRAGERPFSPFREFRFSDQLVWLLIAGVLLVVLPLGHEGMRAGTNVLTFMVALYALRGAAVALALAGSPGLGAMVIGALALVFLYPLVMLATVVVGVSDTWLDLRARRRAAADPDT